MRSSSQCVSWSNVSHTDVTVPHIYIFTYMRRWHINEITRRRKGRRRLCMCVSIVVFSRLINRFEPSLWMPWDHWVILILKRNKRRRATQKNIQPLWNVNKTESVEIKTITNPYPEINRKNVFREKRYQHHSKAFIARH